MKKNKLFKAVFFVFAVMFSITAVLSCSNSEAPLPNDPPVVVTPPVVTPQ